jgi:hypothetical protein
MGMSYGWGWYGTKNLQVCPYMPGVSVYVDGMLSHLYFETKRLGKIRQTFCGDNFNMDKFIHYFESLKTLQVLCRVEENKKLIVSGYSWVSNPRGVDGGRAAQCGFCFLEDGSSGKSNARDLARLAVAYAFEDLRIETLHGVQVIDNIQARNFSMRIGFKPIAVIPDYHAIDGKLVAAQVMMLRKADFWTKFLEWKNAQPKVEA